MKYLRSSPRPGRGKWRFVGYVWIIAALATAALVTAPPQPPDRHPAKPVSLADYAQPKGTGAVLALGSFQHIINRAAEATEQTVLGATASPPSPAPASDVTGNFTIAVLGDSMVHTLGPDVPALKQTLQNHFPNAEFRLHNAGNPGRDIEDGLRRLTNDYTLLGEHKPAVLSLQPDILIIESFAYNHWSADQSDLDRHWLTIAQIIETVSKISPGTQVVLAATIAPHCPTYTDGSANLPAARKAAQCDTVKKYLQNMVSFATSQHYPLADVYHASLDSDGEGMREFIAGDNIHPSAAGAELFARTVADRIAVNGLL